MQMAFIRGQSFHVTRCRRVDPLGVGLVLGLWSLYILYSVDGAPFRQGAVHEGAKSGRRERQHKGC